MGKAAAKNFAAKKAAGQNLLRLPISGVYDVKSVGTVLTGRVELGSLYAWQTVAICSRHPYFKATVRAVEINHRQIEQAVQGDRVAVKINIRPDLVQRGDVAYGIRSGPHARMKRSRVFDAKVALVRSAQVRRNDFVKITMHGGSVRVKMKAIYTIEGHFENFDHISGGDIALVRFESEKPLCLDVWDSMHPAVGPFAIKSDEGGQPMGYGIIKPSA